MEMKIFISCAMHLLSCSWRLHHHHMHQPRLGRYRHSNVNLSVYT
ncbi:unnamed protein product, partial [Vitis vinifera]